MRRLALLAGLLGLLAGCSDSTSPDDAVSGRWRGGTIGVALDMTIARERSTVSGAGNFIVGTNTVALTINGTWVEPYISLVLSSPGFQDTHYGGLLSDGIIDGLLNGSGFTNLEIILSRD